MYYRIRRFIGKLKMGAVTCADKHVKRVGTSYESYVQAYTDHFFRANYAESTVHWVGCTTEYGTSLES